MNSFDMAKALVGSSSRTSNTALHKASQTTTIFGTATSDSEDGKVRVLFDGDSTGTDEDGSIEVSTTFSIKEGDTVIVSLIGADGTGKYPIVVGVEGRGDEIVESISGTATALANYILSNDEALENLQSQIDGAINTWFYAYEPTLQNEPANEWSTATEKNNHLGDLFYNTQTGYCYRFAYTNGAYIWLRVTDTDIATALANAAQAQETADGKATIFTGSTTPTDAQNGDVWFKGVNEGIYTYVNNAWVEYNKYTDDTAANAAQETADDAEAHAQTALTNAATANSTANTANTKANNAIVSQTNYYILSASTPATPTEASHSGWSTTEPAWSATSTYKLYLSIRTAYGSGTITWSAPVEVQAYANINVAKNAIELSVSETYVSNSDLEDALDDYSTTTEMNSAIQQSASSITSTVSATYATKTELGDYSTTTQMNSAIQQSASSITSTVSATYATKTELSETDTKADNAQTAAENAQTAADNAQAEVENKVDIGDSNIEELSSTMKQDANGVNIYNDISHVGDTYAHIDGDEFAIRKISTADTISESDVTMATFGANGMFVSAQNGETSNNALEVALIESETTVPVDLSDYITISGRSVILNAGAKVITSSAAYPFLTLTDISSSVFSVIALYGTNKQHSQSIGLAPTLDPTSNSLSWGRVGTAVPDTFDGEQFTRIVNVNIYVFIAGTVNASSITDGYQTTASGQYSKAEGSRTVASGANSHSEGIETTASGNASHAEGTGTTASSSYSHAEGRNTTADGLYCHAEGDTTTAKGGYSHAEGQYTSANVIASHAEGVSTTVSGAGSHAEGRYTAVSGGYSHAEGLYTLASSAYQHVCGKYNIEDTSDTYAEIVGNGTNATRANARTLDWDGNEKLAGEIDASMRTATVAGYLGTLHLYRFGRVVFVTTDDFKSKSSSVASGTVLTQVVPLGFRPIRIAVVPKPITTSTNNAFFEFGPDGSITYKGSTGWANATAWSGTWITGDD